MRAEGFEKVRRILLVIPRYTSSFGTFEHAYPLTDGVQAFMPPQGLLLIAAYLPANWPVRFIDENIHAATPEDFQWAEAVFVSGMHIQRQQMNDICRRAHAFDLTVAIGGARVVGLPGSHFPFASSRGYRRAVSLGLPGLLSLVRLSACGGTRRRHRRVDRAAGARSVAAG